MPENPCPEDSERTEHIAEVVASVLNGTLMERDYFSADGWQITLPDDSAITLHRKWHGPDRKRIAIRGVYPADNLAWKFKRAEITVSLQRDPTVIAKDIQRRLLPGYQENLKLLRQQQAERDRELVSRRKLTELVAQILPDPRVTVNPTMTEIQSYVGERTRIRIALYRDGRDITIQADSLVWEAAEPALRAIVKHMSQQPQLARAV